jgi:L-fuconolactonase
MGQPPQLIDAHLHLWDPQRLHYAWLAGNAVLDRAFLPPDFAAASAGQGVAKAVFVQCDCDPAQALDEARWVTALTAQEPRLAAIVAHAPVELGAAAVRAHLQRLTTLPLVTGVRRIIQGDAAPGSCTTPAFISGVQELAAFNLSFDLCIGRAQLPDVAALVRACPKVSFILDHGGDPDLRAASLQPWADGLRALAQLPNVACKLSGLVTAGWTPALLRPAIDHIIACFGAQRTLFGGDWPVVLGAATYRTWVDAFRAAIGDLPIADQERICSGTAEMLYLHDLPRRP